MKDRSKKGWNDNKKEISKVETEGEVQLNAEEEMKLKDDNKDGAAGKTKGEERKTQGSTTEEMEREAKG